MIDSVYSNIIPITIHSTLWYDPLISMCVQRVCVCTRPILRMLIAAF